MSMIHRSTDLESSPAPGNSAKPGAFYSHPPVLPSPWWMRLIAYPPCEMCSPVGGSGGSRIHRTCRRPNPGRRGMLRICFYARTGVPAESFFAVGSPLLQAFPVPWPWSFSGGSPVLPNLSEARPGAMNHARCCFLSRCRGACCKRFRGEVTAPTDPLSTLTSQLFYNSLQAIVSWPREPQ